MNLIKRILQNRATSKEPHTKLEDVPDSNVIVVSSYKCTNDKCDEPTKRSVGWGTRYKNYGNGVLLREHANYYNCGNISCTKNHPECTGASSKSLGCSAI